MNLLKLVAPFVLIMGLASCPYNPAPSSEPVQIETINSSSTTEPKASLKLLGAFVKNKSITVQTEVSSPMDTTVKLTWLSGDYVELPQHLLVVPIKAGETKRILFQAQLKRRGFYDITLNAESADWVSEKPPGDRIGFDVVSEQQVRSGEAGGIKSISDHLENLPEATKTTHLEQERDRLAGNDAIPLETIERGTTKEIWNGPDSKPTVVTDPTTYSSVFIPGLGNGKPLPGELEGVMPDGKRIPTRGKQTRASCGTVAATVRFMINNQIANSNYYVGNNGYGSYDLKNMKVTIYEDNGFFGTYVISQGFTDGNGIYRWQKPICDTFWWFDTSPPDLIYQISGVTSYGLESRVGGVANAIATAYTGTYWEETATSRILPLNAPSFSHTKAFWTTNYMIANAMEANVLAGGTSGNSFFPLRVANESIGTFAPIGYIHFGDPYYESYWASPYPVTHEFGHEIMWYAANTSNYLVNFNNGFILNSPGYMDDYCTPYLIVPVAGWAAAIDCFLKIYNHDDEKTYDSRLGWNEGWANFFDSVMYLYFWKRDNEARYADTVQGYYNRHYYCGHPSISCSSALGQGNANRVSSFLFRYASEVLANVTPPARNANSFYYWSQNLSLGESVAILRAYGKIRSALANYGYSRTLFQAWSDRLKALAPAGSNDKICGISKDLGFHLFTDNSFPCNPDGTPKP